MPVLEENVGLAEKWTTRWLEEKVGETVGLPTVRDTDGTGVGDAPETGSCRMWLWWGIDPATPLWTAGLHRAGKR